MWQGRTFKVVALAVEGVTCIGQAYASLSCVRKIRHEACLVSWIPFSKTKDVVYIPLRIQHLQSASESSSPTVSMLCG
jgi:hypothetical protein